MSDRGLHFGGPERKRTPEEVAREIKQRSAAIATLVASHPSLENLPNEHYREVEEAHTEAGRYLQWEGLEKENPTLLHSYCLTMATYQRTVERYVRALQN